MAACLFGHHLKFMTMQHYKKKVFASFLMSYFFYICHIFMIQIINKSVILDNDDKITCKMWFLNVDHIC